MAFANPFAPNLHRARRQAQLAAPPTDHGYSGWCPKIPRVNHLAPDERVAHMHNVESRRQRHRLLGHVNRLKSDLRADNEKATGPKRELFSGVQDDSLDRWSRTRNLAHPSVEESSKMEMIKKDLRFIEESKQQVSKIKRERSLPRPHLVARNPTWRSMHLETMQRSFSALPKLESDSELGAGADPARPPNATGDAGADADAAEALNETAEPMGRSVTFAATTTDSIDDFWLQREEELFEEE